MAGIVRPRPGAEETVYNITVEEAHCYFAEGVLVSNCDALGYFNMGTGEFKAIQGRKKMSNRKPITVKTGWDVFK